MSIKNLWARKWSFFVILFLLIAVGALYLQKINAEYQLVIYKSIPHIELTNTLNVSSGGNFSGVIKGFVVFDNEKDQPKDMSQYYIIEPTNVIDSKNNQIFSLENIIALYPLPPHSVERGLLTIIDNSPEIITLKDDAGNLFLINKITKKVSMKDTSGDSTSLITSDSDYNVLMRNFLQ